MIAESQGYGDRVNLDYAKNPKAASAEEKILGILLLHPEYLREMHNRSIVLTEEDFFTEFGKKIYRLMLLTEGEFDLSSLGETLTVEEVDRLQSIRIAREALADNKIETLVAFIDALREAKGKNDLSLEDLIAQKRRQNKKE